MQFRQSLDGGLTPSRAPQPDTPPPQIATVAAFFCHAESMGIYINNAAPNPAYRIEAAWSTGPGRTPHDYKLLLVTPGSWNRSAPSTTPGSARSV